MNNFRGLDSFHKNRFGYLMFGLVELGLAYLFASLAIDSGDWWEYLLTIIFLFGFLQNAARMVGVHKK